MAEPLLDLGNIGPILKRIGRRCCAQRMHAEAVHLAADASLAAIFADDVVIDRTRVEGFLKLAGAVVSHWPKHGAAEIAAMTRERQIFVDEALRHRVHGNEADFVALAFDLKVHDAAAVLHVANLEPAQFLAADGVIEQSGEDGAIAHALQGVSRRGFNQLAHMGIAERRRRTFIAIRHRPLHTVNGVAGHGVALAEIIEQRRQRRELAADAGRGQSARLEVSAPGDDMGAADGTQFRRSIQTGKRQKLVNVNFVCTAGFGVGDVGEPFELGGDFGQVAILRRREGALFNRHQVLRHASPARVSPTALPWVPNLIMYFIRLEIKANLEAESVTFHAKWHLFFRAFWHLPESRAYDSNRVTGRVNAGSRATVSGNVTPNIDLRHLAVKMTFEPLLAPKYATLQSVCGFYRSLHHALPSVHDF
jgi:hypothetical protein